jgi:hypothetical protein
MTDEQALIIAKYLSKLPLNVQVEGIYEQLMVAQDMASCLKNKQIFWIGVKNGIERYSYYRDGTRYVGVGVVTLAEAMAQVDKEMRDALKS